MLGVRCTAIKRPVGTGPTMQRQISPPLTTLLLLRLHVLLVVSVGSKRGKDSKKKKKRELITDQCSPKAVRATRTLRQTLLQRESRLHACQNQSSQHSPRQLTSIGEECLGSIECATPPSEEENRGCHVNLMPGPTRRVGDSSRQFRLLIRARPTGRHLGAAVSVRVGKDYHHQGDQETVRQTSVGNVPGAIMLTRTFV